MTNKKIKCPQCGRLSIYSLENSYRPFCSERCKLIDLGQWADESYRIPTHITDAQRQDGYSEDDAPFQKGVHDDETE